MVVENQYLGQAWLCCLSTWPQSQGVGDVSLSQTPSQNQRTPPLSACLRTGPSNPTPCITSREEAAHWNNYSHNPHSQAAAVDSQPHTQHQTDLPLVEAPVLAHSQAEPLPAAPAAEHSKCNKLHMPHTHHMPRRDPRQAAVRSMQPIVLTHHSDPRVQRQLEHQCQGQESWA